mgnify:CR=1 FL=1
MPCHPNSNENLYDECLVVLIFRSFKVSFSFLLPKQKLLNGNIYMSEWDDSQMEPSGNFRKLLQERLDKVNPRRTELTAEEKKRLSTTNKMPKGLLT